MIDSGKVNEPLINKWHDNQVIEQWTYCHASGALAEHENSPLLINLEVLMKNTIFYLNMFYKEHYYVKRPINPLLWFSYKSVILSTPTYGQN